MGANDLLIGQLVGELKGLREVVSQRFDSLEDRMSKRDDERAEDRKKLDALVEEKQQRAGVVLAIKFFATFCGLGSLAAWWTTIIKPLLLTMAR